MKTVQSSAQRKLVVYIAASLDGYIAKPNDDLSFLDCVQVEDEDYGYVDFLSTIDTVIVGRKTYDWVLTHVPEYSHRNMDTYVITHSAKQSIKNINFYNGDLFELVTRLKSETGKNIYCDGGAELVNELLRLELIDEIVLSTIPVLLGSGKRLFNGVFPEQKLELISVKSYPSGLNQSHYQFLR